jgi:hypothetical protein
MKAMSKFWTALVVGVAVMAVSTHSWAGPLTINTTTWATLSGLIGPGVPTAPPLVDYFDFSPATPGFDGEIASAVFYGAGAASGLYVYAYQLKLYSTSSAGHLSGVSFDLLTPIAPVPVGGFEVYQVPDPAILLGPADPNTGLLPYPIGATWALNEPPTTSQVSFITSIFRDNQDSGAHDPLGDVDPPHEDITSYLWVFFHPLPPTTIAVNMKDGGPDLRTPLVYTPSPEPSAIVLFGFGIMGLVGIWRRRK